MAILEKIQLAREMICHEDELVNNRVTWFLVTQGILFGAFGEAAKILITEPPVRNQAERGVIFVFIFLMCLFGLYVSLVVRKLLQNANKRLEQVDQWYETLADKEEYPARLRGKLHYDCFSLLLKIELIPIAVALIWVILIAALGVVAVQKI